MSDDLSPAQHTAAIDETRQRLIEFARRCPDEQWHSSPVDGDPRPVSVITDHVADAYEYLAGWIIDIVAGGSPEVNPALVDELNADHSARVGLPTSAQVTAHLKASGDALIKLVGGLQPDQLELADGRVGRLAMIAARHADGHREEIDAALG